MDPSTRDLIRRRAETLFPILRDELLEVPESPELGEAYRFVYLLLRGPRAFLSAFQNGELTLDLESIEEVYWSYRSHLPGMTGLMNEERLIIRDHNTEASDHTARSQPGLRVIRADTPWSRVRGLGG
ncbi:hypothetical protein WDW37_10590 [Bdellovibrionota bacterium FG-1]